jgi:hypothetical protein
VKLNVYQLQPTQVHQAWAQIAPLLEQLEPYCNGECSLEQSKVGLINGASLALVVADEQMAAKSVVLGEWRMTPGKRIFFVTGWAGANAMPDELNDKIEGWVRSNGGTAMQCAVRDSMGRMLKQRWSYKKVYSIFEKEIS